MLRDGFFGLVCIGLMTIVISLSNFKPDHDFSKSLALYIPIVCVSPTAGVPAFMWPIGTGFKVGPHEVMTAGHVSCQDAFGPDAITEVSDDQGLHWLVTDSSTDLVDTLVDVRVIKLNPLVFLKPVAHFRTPRLGERVTVYGQANGFPSGYVGNVTRFDPATVAISVPGIGGLSGSPIVADDGFVVGLVVLSRPYFVEEHFVAALAEGPVGPVLQNVLSSLHNQKPSPTLAPATTPVAEQK